MNWYVMQTVPGKESEAQTLLEHKIDKTLWQSCRILKKQQLFRIHGAYVLNRKELFPGYLFVSTDTPEALAEELKRSREFPQLLGDYAHCHAVLIPVEQKDLAFLENVCGKNLEHDMDLSTVEVDSEGQVQRTNGALKPYIRHITKQRLNKRFVIAKVPLFNRQEEVLFGIRMEGDPK